MKSPVRYAVPLVGAFAIRNEFQDEVAWSLLACGPPAGHLSTRAPHSPGATALSGRPHSSGRMWTRFAAIAQGSG